MPCNFLSYLQEVLNNVTDLPADPFFHLYLLFPKKPLLKNLHTCSVRCRGEAFCRCDCKKAPTGGWRSERKTCLPYTVWEHNTPHQTMTELPIWTVQTGQTSAVYLTWCRSTLLSMWAEVNNSQPAFLPLPAGSLGPSGPPPLWKAELISQARFQTSYLICQSLYILLRQQLSPNGTFRRVGWVGCVSQTDNIPVHASTVWQRTDRLHVKTEEHES